MKKIAAVLLGAALMVAAFIYNVEAASTILEFTKVSATEANTSVTLTAGSGRSTSISIYNSSVTKAVFIKVGAVAVADSTSVEIPPGATLTLDDFAATLIGVICSAGETSTVYIYITR